MFAFVRHGQQQRSLLVCGAGVQDVRAITFFKYSWLSSLSVWRRPSSSTNASGEAQTIDQVWEEYFADRSQWWDIRIDKRNSKSPDFKHKVTRKALWIDGWSTPPWVKTMLKSVTQGNLQPRVGYQSNDPEGTAHSNRLSKADVQTVPGGGGNIDMQSANTTSETIAVLKNRLQKGIAIGSYICGRLLDAHRVFDELVKKDVIIWNVIIGGYAQHNRAKEAMGLFNQMRREGFQPDEVSYVCILKACAKPSTLKWGKEIHEYIGHSGLQSCVRVGTALVQMYAKCGHIKEARTTFDKLTSRNVISWNVMIKSYAESGCWEEAYQLLLQMKREGFKPNAITFLSILNAFTSAGPLHWAKKVHSHVLEAGLESDMRVSTALLHVYAKSGSIDDARLVFDRMEERNVITWTALVGAYAASGCGAEAYELFLQMQREGFIPDACTYVSILNASASAGALEWVREVHRHAIKSGLELDMRVGSALVHMYAKSGSVDDARLVFDRMEVRNLVTWTVMIGALAQHRCGREAHELFLQMQREGFKPDALTYASLLNTCASARDLKWVKQVHRHAQEAGLELDLRVGSTLVHAYAKSGSVDDARLVFDKMEELNVFTWTTMIRAYATNGCGIEAYDLFLQMQREGFIPDTFTYVSILNACASAGALEWVREVHRHAIEAGLELDLRVGGALVHTYAKSGSIDDARLVFDRMEGRDLVTWNVMIGGLAQHGYGYEALEVFSKMNAAGVKPDESTCVAVLSACSHAGLVDEGRRLFLGMAQNYGIEPDVVHYTCMVDLLGRAGHLEEAKLFIDNMPVGPDEVTWGALLGACRNYGNVELGELAAKELMKLKPKGASAYVLLSNIYAAAGKWEEVSLVRTLMQERGIHKETGRSWIEIDSKIHFFVSGDTSHPERMEIYAELSKLTEKIKAEGYLPDTRVVLRNVDEKDKEFTLCSHSEKLAIVYGLIHTPCGVPVRVYKNLRVCSDCHTATKFISKVTRKEIVVRDANRFHYFKDGVCSCQDYW